jgi:hypothetical protein
MLLQIESMQQQQQSQQQQQQQQQQQRQIIESSSQSEIPLGSLLLQMGFVDLYDRGICRAITATCKRRFSNNHVATVVGSSSCSIVHVVPSDRICQLYLAATAIATAAATEGIQCDILPTGIHRLDHLRRLEISSKSLLASVSTTLPLLKDLASLPHLEQLDLLGCCSSDTDRLLSDSFICAENEESVKLEFPRLKKLSISGFLSVQVLLLLLHRCICAAALEHLELAFGGQPEIDRILDTLCCTSDYFCCFAETLKTLVLTGDDKRYEMEGHQLETLLFQVLPVFPNLEILSFGGNIMCFKDIADRIRIRSDNKRCVSSSSNNRSLRIIQWNHFSGNRGVVEDLNKDPDMKAAVLSFLKVFNTIERIFFPCDIQMHSDWNYAMIKNIAGRRIIESNDFGGDGYGSTSSGSGLPLSVWPIVLERFQRKIDTPAWGRFPVELQKWKIDPPQGRLLPESRYARAINTATKATGIFYLLRQGPVLMGRNNPTTSLRRIVKSEEFLDDR